MVTPRCIDRVLARAQQAERDGGLPEALRLAQAILISHPLHAEARLLRARVWARSGRMEWAAEELRHLVECAPDDLEPRLALTGVLLLTGAYGAAVDHLVTVAKQCCLDEALHNEESGQGCDPRPVRPEPAFAVGRPLRGDADGGYRERTESVRWQDCMGRSAR
jgi:thioredoxin-like negative regulator of GroEL